MTSPVKVTINNIDIENVNNNEKDAISRPLDIHCNLNILDSYKDAAHQEPNAKNTTLFINSISKLYSCYNQFSQYNDRQLHEMESMFMGNSDIYGSELRICALSKNKLNTEDLNTEIERYKTEQKNIVPDFISSNIPESYEYALNDAAITPNDFRPGIKEIETPASFIDPGGRGRASIWPQTNEELYIDLTNFGFNGIEFISRFINSEICNIIFKKDKNQILNVNVNRKGEIINNNEQQQYFIGNVTKNTFLNTAQNNPINQQHALNYVLGKELGDTLQVIVGYIMMKYNENEFGSNKIAAFTGDIPFACRCMMLNVPVLLRRLKLNSSESVLRHYSLFIPASLTEEERYKIVHKTKIDDILKHNAGVIFRNNKFKFDKNIEEYIDRSSRFTYENEIFSMIENLLQEVNSFISTINDNLITIRNSVFQDDNIEVHEIYRAFDLLTINKTKHLKLNPLLDRLMSGNLLEDPITNILTTGNFKNTGEYYKNIKKDILKQTTSRRGMRGGTPYSMTTTKEQYNNIQHYPYYVFDILFNYYKFVGGTIIDDIFLDIVINKIINSNSLPTLEEFRNFYETFKRENFDMLENIEKEVVDNDYGNIFDSNTLFLLDKIINYFDPLSKKTKPKTLKTSLLNNNNIQKSKSLKSKSLKPSLLKFKNPSKSQQLSLLSKYSKLNNNQLSIVPEESISAVYGGRKNRTRKHKGKKNINKTRKYKIKNNKKRKTKNRK